MMKRRFIKENQTPWEIVQNGIGIILVLTGVSSFLFTMPYAFAIQNLFLGAGSLIFGLSDKRYYTEKDKMFSYAGSVFMITGAILVFYNTFLNSK